MEVGARYTKDVRLWKTGFTRLIVSICQNRSRPSHHSLNTPYFTTSMILPQLTQTYRFFQSLPMLGTISLPPASQAKKPWSIGRLPQMQTHDSGFPASREMRSFSIATILPPHRYLSMHRVMCGHGFGKGKIALGCSYARRRAIAARLLRKIFLQIKYPPFAQRTVATALRKMVGLAGMPFRAAFQVALHSLLATHSIADCWLGTQYCVN